MVEVTVGFTWEAAGPVEVDVGEALVFPRALAVPGLYRFEFIGIGEPSVYIGETDRLNRRLQHYRTPGPTQLTNIRLNQRMRMHLGAGGIVAVSVTTAGKLTVDGRARNLDFTIKSERRLAEAAAIIDVQQIGNARIENL